MRIIRPTNRGRPLVVAASGAALANTGNTNENTLVTVSIPGGSLGPNGWINVFYMITTTGNTNTKTFRIKYGGTTFHQISHTTATQLVSQSFVLVQNRNSVSSQVSFGLGSAAIALGANTAAVTGAVNTANALDLTITAQCATSGTDTITLERYFVETVYMP